MIATPYPTTTDLFALDRFTGAVSCGVEHNRRPCAPGYVYVARGTNSTIKIGMCSTLDGIPKRMIGISRQYKMGFTRLYALQTHCVMGLEKQLHERFFRCRVNDAGGKELFALEDRQINFLNQLETFVGQPIKRIPAIDFL